MDNNGNLPEDERRNIDCQFYATFKALMLEKRVRTICNAPQSYHPADFLMILGYISDAMRRIKILEHGCNAHPASGEMLECLLGEYIKKREWNRAESFIDNMDGFVATVIKSPQLVKSYLTICLQTKAYRQFIRLEEILLEKSKAANDVEVLRELAYGMGKVYLRLDMYEKAYGYLAPFEDEDTFVALRGLEDLRRVKTIGGKNQRPLLTKN